MAIERFQEKWTRFSVRKRDQIGNLEHFHESINLGNALERIQEKWTRFSVRKRDQIRNLEHFHESINLGNALGV